jgi:hypothetical protein
MVPAPTARRLNFSGRPVAPSSKKVMHDDHVQPHVHGRESVEPTPRRRWSWSNSPRRKPTIARCNHSNVCTTEEAQRADISSVVMNNQMR